MSKIESFPSLYTNKGTVIRLLLGLDKGEEILIDPLSEGVAGICLSPDFTSSFISICELDSCSENQIQLLKSDGSLIRNISLDSKLSYIKPFVIYPDGSTWEGEIGDKLEGLGIVLWSPQLISSINDQSVVSNFFSTNHWEKTPTTLMAWHDNEATMACARIEHTCGKDCYAG